MAIRMQIQDLQDTYVMCRSIGHAWENNPHARVDSDMFKASTACLTLRCTRCSTERFDYIGNDMQVFRRYYRYPEDYTTVASEPGDPIRPRMRAELVRRSLLVRKHQSRARTKAAAKGISVVA